MGHIVCKVGLDGVHFSALDILKWVQKRYDRRQRGKKQKQDKNPP